MIKIQPFLIGLGSMVAKATLPIHEALYQMSDGTLAVNPDDDINDPADLTTQRQLFWWIGGTTLIISLVCIITNLFKKKGKGGFMKRIKKMFR